MRNFGIMKISLITITYNSEKTVADTLQSVLKQSYPHLEYIVVDGASQDDTLSFIQQYEPLFKGKLKWISEPDKGLYDALNKGINMTTGDVIGILNSDDFFTSTDILQQIADAFINHPETDAVYGDVHYVQPNDLNKCVRYYSSQIFKRELMRMGFMPAHPSFYIRRKWMKSGACYKTDYKIAADFEFLLRMIYKNKINTLYLPIDMVTMRTGGLSTSGLKSHKHIMKEHLRAFRENGIYTNPLILSLRYIYKIWEIQTTKFSKNNNFSKATL